MGHDKNHNLISYLITFGKSNKYNELGTFMEYIKELNEGFDTAFNEGSLLEDKYYMPSESNDKDYFSNLRRRNSQSAEMMRSALMGTKFQHLVDDEEYKKLRSKWNRNKARERYNNNEYKSTGRNARDDFKRGEGDGDEETKEEEETEVVNEAFLNIPGL